MRFIFVFELVVIYLWFIVTSIGAEDKITALPKHEYLTEKKIRFTGNSAQYIKFEAKLPSLLDFAMCIWYKPDVILEHNILFFYGNGKDQLITWKIKKNLETPVVILKIRNIIVMEEKIEGLVTGRWHHLCQYWQGSTGFWALFFNNYIVSFAYHNMTTNSNWHIKGDGAIATINHPKTKQTLQGEVYGFYLTSMNYLPHERQLSNETSGTIFNKSTLFFLQESVNMTKGNFSKLHKRQTQPEPSDPDRRPFVVKVFTFIGRMVSLVTVPIARFVRALIMPWRRPFTSPRPSNGKTNNTSAKIPISSTTETVTVTNSSVTAESSTLKNGARIREIDGFAGKKYAPTHLSKPHYTRGSVRKPNLADLAKLEAMITIYEIDSDPELRYLRNIINSTSHNTNLSRSPDSMESLIEPEENLAHSYLNKDKCLIIEEKLEKNFEKRETGMNAMFRRYASTNTENPVDAITYLGTNLQYMQFLYMCCTFRKSELLLSWDKTTVLLNNVVIDNVSGCANF